MGECSNTEMARVRGRPVLGEILHKGLFFLDGRGRGEAGLAFFMGISDEIEHVKKEE